MIAVFITDLQNEVQANRVSDKIQSETTGLKVNFDFNETALSFPCGHTILRIEGATINSDETIATVNEQGFESEVLEDKICK